MLAALGLAHKGHNNYRDLGVSCAVVADRPHGHTLEQPFMLCSYNKQIGVLGRVYEPITRIALDDPPVDFRSLVCRSEEHTSELQSRFDLVCRLLLEKNNIRISI